jgi:hypothetical protein
MSIKFEVFGLACVDCVIAIANDDYSALTPKRVAEVRAGLEQAGYLIVGDEVGHTWGKCDVCGSGGGDKHEVLCEVLVCADCGDETEGGGLCSGCRSNESVRTVEVIA